MVSRFVVSAHCFIGSHCHCDTDGQLSLPDCSTTSSLSLPLLMMSWNSTMPPSSAASSLPNRCCYPSKKKGKMENGQLLHVHDQGCACQGPCLAPATTTTTMNTVILWMSTTMSRRGQRIPACHSHCGWELLGCSPSGVSPFLLPCSPPFQCSADGLDLLANTQLHGEQDSAGWALLGIQGDVKKEMLHECHPEELGKVSTVHHPFGLLPPSPPPPPTLMQGTQGTTDWQDHQRRWHQSNPSNNVSSCLWHLHQMALKSCTACGQSARRTVRRGRNRWK